MSLASLRLSTGAVRPHLWYRRFRPHLWRCCYNRDDVRCRCDDALGPPWRRCTLACVEPTKSRWGVGSQSYGEWRRGVGCQAGKQASQKPAHSVATYLGHHRTATNFRRSVFRLPSQRARFPIFEAFTTPGYLPEIGPFFFFFSSRPYGSATLTEPTAKTPKKQKRAVLFDPFLHLNPAGAYARGHPARVRISQTLKFLHF